MRPSQLSDESLVEQIRLGETDAFHALYDRYEKKLFGFIYNFLKNRQASEEIFHDALMSVLKDNEANFELGSFRGWIYCVARNLCLNRLRSDGRDRKARDRYYVAVDFGEPARSDLGVSDLVDDLKAALEKLPRALEEIYSLRMAGLSYEEMAQSLRIPLGTVKSRMHEMVKVLRKEIET